MALWLDGQFGPGTPTLKYQELFRKMNSAAELSHTLRSAFQEVERRNAVRTAGQYGWQAADDMWRKRWDDLRGNLFVRLDDDAMRVVRSEMEELYPE